MSYFNRLVTLIGFAACLVTGPVCRAGLIEVDIVDAVMTAGSSGYIDVIVRGTGAPIAAFDYTITIAGAGPGTGNVVFTSHVLAVTNINDPRPYVFYGNGSSPSVQVSNTELTGNDILDVGEINVNGEYLLARLNVEHQGELSGDISETTFILSVTQATFAHSVLDDDLVELLTPYNSGDITLGTGTLKIVATPEPATLGALGFASIFVVRKLQLRRRSDKKLKDKK